eukprot:338901-Pelagomonas_calceolata.AAC.3
MHFHRWLMAASCEPECLREQAGSRGGKEDVRRKMWGREAGSRCVCGAGRQAADAYVGQGGRQQMCVWGREAGSRCVRGAKGGLG